MPFGPANCGTAEAVPFQIASAHGVFQQPLKPCPDTKRSMESLPVSRHSPRKFRIWSAQVPPLINFFLHVGSTPAVRPRVFLIPLNRIRLNNRTDDKPNASCAVATSVAGLWKRYGATAAVCDVSFEVGAGQIFGLLGANGAGKTTTLECILGLRQPDGGSIQINGLDLRNHAAQAKRLVGAQLQAATLQDRITPRQALDLFGSFYSQSFGSGELLARFDLEAKADVPFATLSGGLRQRLFLALALINRPTLLVLDEPTAGLDPQARRKLRSLIGEMRSNGRTVLLSTHDLQEADELCDRIAIMDSGRIVAVASPAELIGRSESPARLIVRTAPCLARTVLDALPRGD